MQYVKDIKYTEKLADPSDLDKMLVEIADSVSGVSDGFRPAREVVARNRLLGAAVAGLLEFESDGETYLNVVKISDVALPYIEVPTDEMMQEVKKHLETEGFNVSVDSMVSHGSDMEVTFFDFPEGMFRLDGGKWSVVDEELYRFIDLICEVPSMKERYVDVRHYAIGISNTKYVVVTFYASLVPRIG